MCVRACVHACTACTLKEEREGGDMRAVCLFVCLFICLFVCLFTCLFVCLLVCLFVCLPVCLFVCLPVYLFVCLLVCMRVTRNHFSPSHVGLV